ncbi:MAG TPA: enoyl-CoA hydratase/isomerase family protein, partial [Mycobacterium sp.]|uniref:enoyl-CoA hydratase/isomerase family protein n=1 Tax=Mycobacterium sp. TaxID=1785 RepID=UPI002D4C8A3C
MEQRILNAVIYQRDPPIARIILNRPEKANTKDSTLVREVDECLHDADRDGEIKVVILKANGNGFCGGHVARWGPDENPYPEFGTTFEELYKGTADLFLWPTLYLWEFPKPTISQIHGYCMGGGIYLGLLTDFCVASEDAYF